MAHIAGLFVFWLALNNRLATYADLIKPAPEKKANAT